VKAGADGYVDLANASAGSTNLVADLQGCYRPDGAAGYATVVVAVGNLDPSLSTLACDIGLAGLPLGVQ